MEYLIFDNLTNEEVNIIVNNVSVENFKISDFEKFSRLQDEGLIVTVYAGINFNFISSKFLKMITEIDKKTQIKVVLIEKVYDNSKFVVEWIQDLKRNNGFNVSIIAELNRDNLAEDLSFLNKAKDISGVQSEETKKDNNVVIYTDGACSGNPGAGGWGAVLFHGDYKKEISGYEKDTTNNRMELTAVIKSLQMLKSPCNVELYSDSAYVVNAFLQGWLENWKKNGWIGSDKKQVKNIELWQELDRLINIHNVHFNKVKGHSDNEFNNRCDELATGEIAKHINQ